MARDDGYTTFSVRAPNHVAQRIDSNAERSGLSRSAYVLTWLPEAHDEPVATKHETAVNNARSRYR